MGKKCHPYFKKQSEVYKTFFHHLALCTFKCLPRKNVLWPFAAASHVIMCSPGDSPSEIRHIQRV